MKKGVSINRIRMIFFAALLLLGLGSFVLYFTWQQKQIFPLFIGGLFVVCGVVEFCYSIYEFFNFIKANRLFNDPNAYITNAKFIDLKNAGKTSVGARNSRELCCYYKIKYEYTDENGVLRRAVSLDTYLSDQANKFLKMGTFSVKCKGKNSVIIENLE